MSESSIPMRRNLVVIFQGQMIARIILEITMIIIRSMAFPQPSVLSDHVIRANIL